MQTPYALSLLHFGNGRKLTRALGEPLHWSRSLGRRDPRPGCRTEARRRLAGAEQRWRWDCSDDEDEAA